MGLRKSLLAILARGQADAPKVVLHQITDLFKGRLASANASRFGAL